MTTKLKNSLGVIGVASALALLIALLIEYRIADFTTPLVDAVTADSNHKGTTSFWSHVFIKGLFENFLGTKTFLHPNWWKVLLGVIAYIVMAFYVLTLVISREAYDNLTFSVCDDTKFPMAWMRFYYAFAGIIISFGMDLESGQINAILLFAPAVLIYLSFWRVGAGLLPTLWLLIVNIFIAAVCCCMAWIAIICLICGAFRGIMTAGSTFSIGGMAATKVGDKFITTDGRSWRPLDK